VEAKPATSDQPVGVEIAAEGAIHGGNSFGGDFLNPWNWLVRMIVVGGDSSLAGD
jgi:hypothetical protein